MLDHIPLDIVTVIAVEKGDQGREAVNTVGGEGERGVLSTPYPPLADERRVSPAP